MLLTPHRRPILALPDLADVSFFPFFEPMIKIEEYRKDDRFVVRAELPGVDPVKDVTITVEAGLLRLSVLRTEATEDKQDGRSEFRYGTFHRTITLPLGTKEDSISAKYHDGILEITMKVGEPARAGRTIPVAVENGQPKQVKKN